MLRPLKKRPAWPSKEKGILPELFEMLRTTSYNNGGHCFQPLLLFSRQILHQFGRCGNFQQRVKGSFAIGIQYLLMNAFRKSGGAILQKDCFKTIRYSIENSRQNTHVGRNSSNSAECHSSFLQPFIQVSPKKGRK